MTVKIGSTGVLMIEDGADWKYSTYNHLIKKMSEEDLEALQEDFYILGDMMDVFGTFEYGPDLLKDDKEEIKNLLGVK